MANATSNLVYRPYGLGGRNIHMPVDGGSHIYEGTLVSQLTGTGMLVPGSTASSGPAVGVATHETDNTGSDGAKRCVVHTDRVFLFDNGSGGDACSEATLLGAPVYMFDDHTVYDNDAGGTLKRAGYFAGMESDGKVRVFVTAFGAGAHVQPVTAPTALTFTAVAGTANTTLEAMPNPTDTPADADALRDDIVANLLPPLRNNIADLATAVNTLRTALINAGLTV